jgi:hypothetical protein
MQHFVPGGSGLAMQYFVPGGSCGLFHLIRKNIKGCPGTRWLPETEN